MSARVYVGGLAWETTNESLKTCFETCGPVTDAYIIKDRETGRSKGFGFVTFESSDDASKAVQEMNSQDLDGRSIRVDLANERQDRPRGDRDGGDRRGGDRGGDRERRPYDREERPRGDREERGDRDDRRGGDRDDRRGGDRERRPYDREERPRGDRGDRGGDRERRERY